MPLPVRESAPVPARRVSWVAGRRQRSVIAVAGLEIVVEPPLLVNESVPLPARRVSWLPGPPTRTSLPFPGAEIVK